MLSAVEPDPPSGDRPPGLAVAVLVPGRDLAPGPALDLYLSRVPAGFPSPADDYAEDRLDLHALLGLDSPSCFVVQAEGWSMRDEGIFDGDLMVVDRAVEPQTGMVVVAAVDGELTVKRYVRRGRRAVLLAANPDHEPIELAEGQELVVWGVVTHSVRFHLRVAGVRRRNRGRPPSSAQKVR